MPDSRGRNQLEREFLKGRIPFALDETTYCRFPERNNGFSRVSWDASFLAFGRGVSEREAEMLGRRGYSRIGYAASSASWLVHKRLAKELRRRETPSPEQISPAHLRSALPRHNPVDPMALTGRIKRLGQVFGACDVGVANVDPGGAFIYSHDRDGAEIHLPREVSHAVVLLTPMDYRALLASPRLPASIAVGNGYSRAAFTAGCLAETIRNLGYHALPSVNSLGLSVPLAVMAGLGEFGRNGLLIHPKFGQSVQIAKVFTNLPLVADSPKSFGAANFCRSCMKCARACPSQSIPEGEPTWESPWNTPSNNNGVYKWYVNADTCYEFWTRNSTYCSNCIRACPFTKPPGFVHDVVRFFIRNVPLLNRLWVKLDDVLGYGEAAEPSRFWASEEYMNKKVAR